jgi:DNA-binding transcriptional ArsR family regulator
MRRDEPSSRLAVPRPSVVAASGHLPYRLAVVPTSGLPGSPRRVDVTVSFPYYLLMHADSEGTGRALPPDQVDLAVEVFRMLADATRVQILWALIVGELSVSALAEQTGKAPASVSQHLAKLRMARLVRTRREGTTVFYRLDNDHVAQLITDAVYNAEHAGPGVPSHHRSGQLARLRPTDANDEAR